MYISSDLSAVLDAYSGHPEFLGIHIVDVNQKGAMDSRLLHIAARLGRVDHMEVLVRAGAELDAKGDLGNTALHEAAMSGQAESVRFLIACGADMGIKNEFEQSPADIARIAGDPGIMVLLP